MGRKEPAKGKHSSPLKSGEQNVENAMVVDDTGVMSKIMPIYEQGKANSKAYKGLWTEETLSEQIDNYFQYCYVNNFKPTKTTLCLWLALDKSMYSEWENNPTKYSYKSELLKKASLIMESYLMGNIDKYPTGNIFLLKTSFGHVEASKLDVTSNGNTISDANEVRDLVSKLGLDKKTE